MGLSASMWTGVAGLGAHGEQMGVIGNNIANVNTVGFKGSRMYFEDFISQDVNTAAGIGQIGRGVGIGAIYADFGQSGFETTTEATDLGIGGRGFFRVKVKNEETNYYTRAGNFRFDKDGYLVDPHGYVLQGWEIPSSSGSSIASGQTTGQSSSTSSIKGTGAPKDIRVEGFTAQPKATENVTMVVNLDGTAGQDNSTWAANPFFSMFSNWDGQAETPLGDTQFGYQSTIKVYDEGGTAHELTVYFDQVTASNSGGNQYWEYMVTVPPSEDGRTIGGVAVNGTSAAGIMMVGSLTFDSAGQLRNQSAFTLDETSTGTNIKELSNWKAADFNTDGQPVFVANFTLQSNASVVGASNAKPIAVNFGLTNGDPNSGWSTGATVSNASQVGTDINNLPGFSDPVLNSKATTSFAGSSSTQFQSQDGYTFGFLQSVSVDRDGILTGRYSNGVVLELYQVTLYDFVNKWGLRRDGSNLFSETRESGEATAGPANANGYGSINSNSLEQSNVDLAKEFVKMISTERGFQANSKVITTTDNMLQTVISMKR
ncbi:flagellar hook protein FlgE [Desulfobaculum xiamenense]|uniref:Flagellar hook protein FlgE n=1 Tax=Desulfobaculum xiamenense TaxID=995050 RepID=A0A846QN65_9BACT|nr:flagellar hook protein FlgE [Desulfobaculum xiamenense]NJB68460.1 flagellar hook protein FlgE [Desulfobaculum xiamenense]